MTAEELRLHAMGRTHGGMHGLKNQRTRALIMHAGGGLFARGFEERHAAVGA